MTTTPTSTPTIAVTAASGHLGRLAVEALLDAGHPADQVVATARNAARLSDLAARGVRTAEADYGDPDSLEKAFQGVDTVLLVSGSEVGRRVEQHRNAIEAAERAGVTRVVYTSAPHADTSALAVAPEHKATEELLAASPLATTVLRNGWYTENYLPALEQARQSGVLAASAGDGRVASASRADYAAAAAVVLTQPGHEGAVYELSGDHAWTHDELASALAEVLGRPVAYQRLTPEEHLAALRAAGLPDEVAGFVVALDANTRDGLLAETSGDLARLIGRPTTPLVDGLRAAIS